MGWNTIRRLWPGAVYLHDWGAYPRYALSGVEHPQRSRQVAETEILPFTNDLSSQAKATVLGTIDLHDYHDTRPVTSNEALLLREADYLDFLGVVGIARGFAGAGKDLPKGLKVILSRKELVQARFTLPAAQAVAATRMARMEVFLQALEEESGGIL